MIIVSANGFAGLDIILLPIHQFVFGTSENINMAGKMRFFQ